MHIEMWRSNADRTAVQVELARKVWEQLRRDPTLDAGDLQADVSDFVAILSGTVRRLPDKIAAERAAARVPKIRAVLNDIIVAPRPADVRTDRQLARAAAHALQWNSLVPQGRVRARVSRGWVTLEGDVDAAYERAAAEAAVRDLVGVRGVACEVEIRPGTPTAR